MSLFSLLAVLGLALAGPGDDLDGDGYCYLMFQVGVTCNDPTLIPGDCDDDDTTIYPSAPELCDMKDNNCNGSVDEINWDVDGDGYTSVNACEGSKDDCNDYLASVHPGAVETCDGMDENCDGVIDDGLIVDADGDGFPGPGCTEEALSVDCNDDEPQINPSASEVLGDGIDNNCDGFADVAVENVDNDGDGYCEGVSLGLCESKTFNPVLGVLDCDDSDPTISFNSFEWLDGVDNDCSGIIDDLDSQDRDGDGYCGNPSACTNSALLPGDCNDSNPQINPGAEEICNGIDDDCDGLIWDEIDERDSDGDGHLACEGCEEGVRCGDCDDANAQVYLGQTEDCSDQIDNDCDGRVDEPVDLDGDGHYTCLDDCDDSNSATFLDNPEICDGLDNNCDGVVDEGFDIDGDGYRTCDGDCNDTSVAIHPGRIEVCGDGIDNNCDGLDAEDGDDDGDQVTRCGGDCDDSESGKYINRYQPEICDGIDNDCDGLVDETYDLDGDGHYTCFGDCNDDPDQSGELAYAGREESEADCDEVDNDCNGVVDDLWPDLDEDGYTQCQGDCDDEQGWGSPDFEEVCQDEFDNDCDGDADLDDADCVEDDTGRVGPGAGLQIEGSVPASWFCSVSSLSSLPPLFNLVLVLLVYRRRSGACQIKVGHS